jgi:hypothetical protein
MKTSDVVNIWRSKEGQEWSLTFTLAEIRGRRECIAFQIEPAVGFIDHVIGKFSSDNEDGLGGLSTSVLREVRFTSELALAQRETAPLHRVAAEMIARAADEGARAAHLANGEREAAFVELPLGTKSGRRTKYGREDFERVADAYRAAKRDGSITPTADVARQLGLGHNQAAKLVQRCRQDGILEPYPRRRQP